jgi:outer membrane protein OmpA-like peptidoglycan-associated protein
MIRGRVLVLTLVALAAIAAACKKRIPVAATQQNGSLIVLLPEADGSLGSVSVTNAAGTVDLAAARDATRVVAGQAPAAPAPMAEAEVQRIFGGVLSALPRAPRHFILFFQFDSDTLTAESQRLLADILQAITQYPAPEVIAVGHTDTVGNATSNYELGLRRATIIRNQLVAVGLDPALIEVTSHGEADPLVRTADDTPEQRNRRVEIEVK